MRKIRNETTIPSEGTDRDNSGGWLKSHWCVLALGVIVIAAFLLRFVFAYGVSADGDYALSGGSSAQYHLHVIESILNGSWSMTDASVNYPIGGILFIPPLMDFLGAGVATLFQGSMGTTEAASMALAVLNPIFGALACIPVFMIGKELYDKTIGVVSALVFAFLALPISTSVFSSGTEYALAAFLIAFMAYFAIRMVKAADSEGASRKGIMINAALAGVFLALAALTWNGFRFAVVLFAVAMVLQAVAPRVRGKDFTDITLGYVVAILIGTLVPAAYYVPAGLMDAVYSGSLIIAIVSVVLTAIFLALAKKPWIVMIPALVVVFVAFCIALALAVPEVFNDFFFGNEVYVSSIMEQLANNRVSMSNVAAYYGWLTVWMPICLALYQTYVYFRKDHSATMLFQIVWLFVMFFAAWTSFATSAVVGSVFAVGAAAVFVKLIREADLPEYWANIKAAGFPGCFRKIIKPLPFVTVLTVALLVVVPNFGFAVDAGQPTNTEGDHFYTGNTSFTIKTGDDYPVGEIWASYEDAPKDGAIVTWIDYAYDAVAQGGFDNVTDAVGGGATAAAQMYLADGSAGAIAAMMLRIMTSIGSVDYSSCFTDATVYATVKAYIDDPAKAIEEIKNNPDAYGEVRSDITDENAVYLAALNTIVSDMDQLDIMTSYEKVCDASGKKIGYMLMDGSMLPLQYGDGGDFSTIAYFADYAVDSYGAATQFYSYNTYYGYTNYTSEIYDTLLWKALIGPSASEAGFTSSYSYLTALALSDGKDGSVKAMPGYGLVGFDVVEWKVMYNADSEATVSDEGWEYMDAMAAMEKQDAEGGMINYLQGIVLLDYSDTPVDSAAYAVYDGTVKSTDGTAISGATVAVYQYDDIYGKEVLYSETVTRDGAYRAIVPAGDYRIDVRIGDLVLQSFTSAAPSAEVLIEESVVVGEVRVNGHLYDSEDMMVNLKSDASEMDVQVVDGMIAIDGILPGTYAYSLFGANGSSLGTGNVTVYPGESEGFFIEPKTYTITVTVNDFYGESVDGTAYPTAPMAMATNTVSGAMFATEIGEDGKAIINVIPGEYTVAVGGGLVTMTSTTQNVSSSNKSTTLTAYESNMVSVSGVSDGTVLTVSAGDYSTVAKVYDGAVFFDVPVGLATVEMCYSVYGMQGGKMVYGVYEGGDSMSLSSVDYSKVTGKLKNGTGDMAGIVTLYNQDEFRITASTDSKGQFTIFVPRGDYTIYASNESDKVYFGAVGATSAEKDLGELSAVDGRKITHNFKYDQATNESNKNLPFVLALATFEYDGKAYTLTTMTNTSGVATFYVPDNVAVTGTFNNAEGILSNDAFECKKLSYEFSSSTSSLSNTITIQYDGYQKDQNNVVKQVPITFEYDATLTYYEKVNDEELEFDVKAGETVNIRPGQYEAVVDGASGAYFKGTIYLYPGQNQLVGFNVEEVVTVNITKAEQDTLRIESEGSYHSFTGGYYFEKGYEYYLTATNSKTEDGKTVDMIQYGYLAVGDESTGTFDIDMTVRSAEMEVTGYAGVSGDGTLTVTTPAGVKMEFDIEDGAYTMVLPSDMTSVTVVADITTTVASEEYRFVSEEVSFFGMTDGCFRNLVAYNAEVEDEDEPAFEVTIDSAEFKDGVANVTFSVKNNGSHMMTYLVTAGSAWSLDAAASITVPVGGTGTMVVSGTYDDARVAPGLDGVTLIVKDINGKETVTTEIYETVPTGEAKVELVEGEDAANPKVTASQYMYALTLTNKGTSATEVAIDLNVPNGWYVTIMDADGTFVGKVGDKVPVYGLQTVTYYVVLMQIGSNPGEESKTVPAIDVTIEGVKKVSLQPVEVDVETEKTDVSGGDAMSERSGIPTGIWILVAIIILMLIMTCWLASKRGVFARK